MKKTVYQDNALLFYEIMNYPVPKPTDFFLFNQQIEKETQNILTIAGRETTNPYTQEYIIFINKRGWLFKSLPFIRSIYLCNSITFNATNEKSDIDIFIVVKKGRLRLARFYSLIFFSILNIRHNKKNKIKKFCLSFYATENFLDFSGLLLKPFDIYFIYRLAHLVVIYDECNDAETMIYQQNSRFHNYLPQHPGHTIINLGQKKATGSSFLKKIIETVHYKKIGDSIEYIIRLLRTPLHLWRKKINPMKFQNITISEKILKFYMDKRKKIQFLYNVKTKKHNS